MSPTALTVVVSLVHTNDTLPLLCPILYITCPASHTPDDYSTATCCELSRSHLLSFVQIVSHKATLGRMKRHARLHIVAHSIFTKVSPPYRRQHLLGGCSLRPPSVGPVRASKRCRLLPDVLLVRRTQKTALNCTVETVYLPPYVRKCLHELLLCRLAASPRMHKRCTATVTCARRPRRQAGRKVDVYEAAME